MRSPSCEARSSPGRCTGVKSQLATAVSAVCVTRYHMHSQTTTTSEIYGHNALFARLKRMWGGGGLKLHPIQHASGRAVQGPRAIASTQEVADAGPPRCIYIYGISMDSGLVLRLMLRIWVLTHVRRRTKCWRQHRHSSSSIICGSIICAFVTVVIILGSK